MTAQDYPVYDFVAASQVERPLQSALKKWMNQFNKLCPERWHEIFGTNIQTESMSIQSYSFEDAKQKWVRPAIGVPFTINSNTPLKSVAGLIVIDRIDAILLILDILNETLSTKPDDRELTSVESSIASMVYQTLAAVFGEAWPAKETIPISVGAIDLEPDNSRLFPPDKEVILTGFEIKTVSSQQTGPARFQWIFGKEELVSLLEVPSTNKIVPDGKTIDPLNISQIDVSLAACLGTTQLSMSDLVRLKSGAIIVFDQPIDQPLIVKVNDQPLIRAWPGQTDKVQNVLVDSLMEPAS